MYSGTLRSDVLYHRYRRTSRDDPRNLLAIFKNFWRTGKDAGNWSRENVMPILKENCIPVNLMFI